MEIFRFNIVPDEEFTARELFKRSILNCQICGEDLQFDHKKQNVSATVKEEAHCPSCHIQLKSQTFTLN